MSTGFDLSRTRVNLMRAFAGECMSETRYFLAEAAAQKQQYAAIARLFRFTAEQERQHAKVFMELMKELSGENVDITAGFPAECTDDVQQLLDFAAKDERSEASEIYPDLARIADDEGFGDIAGKFRMIAAVEDIHRRRFEYYGELMRSGDLFRSENGEQCWICLNCGHIHYGTEPPTECPVCSMPQGWRVRGEEADFTFT